MTYCVFTYACVCVCVCPHLHCSSLNCWHSVFKASCFSSKWKYVDLHLFFLPVLFRWPHLHSWGAETISKHKVQKHASNSDLTRHTWTLFASPFIPFGKIFETVRASNQCRWRWGFIIGTVFLARWAVGAACIRWVITSSCTILSSFAPRNTGCVALLMLPLHPKGKLLRLKSSVAACRILNPIEIVFWNC